MVWRSGPWDVPWGSHELNIYGLRRFSGGEEKQVILLDPIDMTRLLKDHHKMRILTTTERIPRSMNYLSAKLDIPIAACYKCTRELEKEGLLVQTDRVLTPRGKRISLYRSNIISALLTYEKGVLRSTLELSNRSMDVVEKVMV